MLASEESDKFWNTMISVFSFSPLLKATLLRKPFQSLINFFCWFSYWMRRIATKYLVHTRKFSSGLRTPGMQQDLILMKCTVSFSSSKKNLQGCQPREGLAKLLLVTKTKCFRRCEYRLCNGIGRREFTRRKQL